MEIMITKIRSGFYKLIETKHNTKVLYLDDEVYAWIEPKDIGEILVTSRRQHRTDCILGVGRFNMLKVEEEPLLSDHIHLELEVGRGVWQGYLLLTGLPDVNKPKARIIPTGEIITGNRKYTNRKDVHLHAVSGK
jgi:hypothetical protein